MSISGLEILAHLLKEDGLITIECYYWYTLIERVLTGVNWDQLVRVNMQFHFFKGRLILKFPFGVFKSAKNPTKLL
jgi:hypothetical protein